MFSFRFFAHVTKTTRFRAFPLRKRAENHAFSRVFRDPLAAPLVFRFSKSLSIPFLCFFRNLAKTTHFHTFFEIWPQTLCVFLGSQISFLAYPEPTCGSKWLLGAFAGRPRLKNSSKTTRFRSFFVFQFHPKHNAFFFVFFENVAKTVCFHTFFRPRGVRFRACFFVVFACSLFKNGIRNYFWHISSHAWPKKIDFVASETIRRHFPSLIEPCMVRMYSFRGFWNSFWTFPMADPEAHFWHLLVPGSRMLIELPKAYFRHFSALSLPWKCTLLDSRNSFWEFLGSWSEILDSIRTHVFRASALGCGSVVCQIRF